MCLRYKTKFSGTTVGFCDGKYSLQVLPFIFWHSGIAETTDLWMFPQNAKQGRSTAPVESAEKDEFVTVHRLEICRWLPRIDSLMLSERINLHETHFTET